jgi:hypothetical protein
MIMKTFYLVLLVLAALALMASTTQQEMTTIHVVEHVEAEVVTDTGEEDDSMGDILTFANPVFDENNEQQVGTDNGYCFRTVVGAAWECAWTLTLEDGQITVQGPFYDASDSALAITGGTGAYAGARGQMSLHVRNAEGTELDFVYEISQ